MPTESDGMEAFNMKKKRIISIIIITIIYFVLSLCDFMYIPADKYPNIIRKMFFHDNEKVTVRSIGRVCQTKEGIYFLYRGRLMYMNSVGTEVKEVASDWQPIEGIMIIENNIFCIFRDKLGLYEISMSSNNDYVEGKGNIIEFISGEKDDRFYTDDKYIYCFSDGMLEKYTLDGRKVYSSKVFYEPRPILGIGSTVFNGYSVCINGNQNPYGDMGIDVPCYYIFNWNKVKYKQKRLGRVRYYSEASPWESLDCYFSKQENIEPYSAWTWKMDYIIRNDKSWWKEEIHDRNVEEYEPVSIKLYDLNPNYYRVLDGYIYFTQRLEITYRDKNYKDKLSGNMNEYINTYENKEYMSKIKYEVKLYPIGRVKVDDIKNILDSDVISYDDIDRPLSNSRNRNDFTIRDKKVYISYIEDYVENNQEYRELKIYEIDAETGISKEVYTMKGLSADERMIEIFVTDNYIFIYRYIDNYGKLCITRVNRDGSNPVLVMDENGEVVMQALEK